jgi:hypothetical protein
VNDPDGSERFIRVVGKRQPAPMGSPPNDESRAATSRMATYRTRAPKGVFIYASHEAANRDRDRWIVDAIVERERRDASG